MYLAFSLLVYVLSWLGYAVHKSKTGKGAMKVIDCIAVYMWATNIVAALFMGTDYLLGAGWIPSIERFIAGHCVWHLAAPMVIWSSLKRRQQMQEQGTKS